MTKEAYSFARKVADGYDSAIRRSIAGYDTLHQVAGLLLADQLKGAARILCVGSGTGQELVDLGRRSPAWRFVGIDKSDAMLELAKERIAQAGMQERVILHHGETGTLPQGELFDAATALLVMHFLPDDGTKDAFLKEIATRLKPGAPYIHADLFGELGTPGFQKTLDAWRAFQLASGTPPEEAEEFFKVRFPQTHPIGVGRTEKLLKEAGFEVLTRPFAVLAFGSWMCRRAS